MNEFWIIVLLVLVPTSICFLIAFLQKINSKIEDVKFTVDKMIDERFWKERISFNSGDIVEFWTKDEFDVLKIGYVKEFVCYPWEYTEKRIVSGKEKYCSFEVCVVRIIKKGGEENV